MHKGSKTHKKKNKKLGKPKKHKNETILRDSCLDPPKSEKNKTTKKTLGNKKQFSETLAWTPFSSRLPENWFVDFCFFGFLNGFLFFLILEGPAKSL